MSAEMRKQHRAAAGEAAVRVLILGNHPLIRAGLRKVIEDAGLACVVHEGGDDSDVSETVSRCRPHVVLVDLDACERGRIAAIAATVHERSAARLLVLSGDRAPETCQRLARVGAMGFVAKDEPADVLVKAIEKVSRGEVWFDRSAQAGVLAGLRLADRAGDAPEAGAGALTGRECEIVRSVAEGLNNKQIAARLFISGVTVRHHLTSIYSKLGVSNRQRLMLYAFQRGLVPPPGRAAG